MNFPLQHMCVCVVIKQKYLVLSAPNLSRKTKQHFQPAQPSPCLCCVWVCIHTQRLAESVVVKTWARAEEGSQPLDRLCSRAKPKLGLSRFNVLLKESLFVFIIDLSFYFLL